jgi:hypothetical protein
MPSNEFTPRGGSAEPSDVELRALTVEPREDGGFDVHATHERALGQGDFLRLIYKNLGDYDRVTVELVAPDRRVTLLEDHPIAPADEAKLGDPIPVGDWPAGDVELRATFYRKTDSTVRTVRAQVEAR